MTGLLTETTDYDEPGSWGPASNGWPGIRGDHAYDMYVFANCVDTIPYGSYVLMSQKGEYGDKVSYLRVHPDHIKQLKADFKAAGKPNSDESVSRREQTGKLRRDGLRESAPKWWLTDEV